MLIVLGVCGVFGILGVLGDLVWILDLGLWDPGELAQIHGSIQQYPGQLAHIFYYSHIF